MSMAGDAQKTPLEESVRSRHLVVVVEDSDDDFYALKRAVRGFSGTLELKRFSDGSLASEYLHQCEQPSCMPELILLDLNVPGMSGHELLKRIKGSEKLKRLPVIIYSTSDSVDDIRYCYANHANAYHTKPLDFDRMRSDLTAALDYWLNLAKKPYAT